jgi:hypothetical protein
MMGALVVLLHVGLGGGSPFAAVGLEYGARDCDIYPRSFLKSVLRLTTVPRSALYSKTGFLSRRDA